jgi:hypothetical protein
VDAAHAHPESIAEHRFENRSSITSRSRPLQEGDCEVERDAIVDEIEAFAGTIKVKRRISLRKLIEEGRK